MTAGRYFRIAAEKSKVGDLLRGRGYAPLKNRGVEQLLDAHKPVACISRSDCVYMREDRKFSKTGVELDSGYVHEVVSLGITERRDTVWIGVLQLRFHPNDRLRRRPCKDLSDVDIAFRYWHGIASDDPHWEVVAREARVLSIDAEETSVRSIPNAFQPEA